MTAQSRTHGAAHELTAIGANSITLDVKGNITEDQSKSSTYHYEWDFDNRMSAASVDGSSSTYEIQYTYDALGRRVSKAISRGMSTTTIVYTCMGAQVTSEYSANSRSTVPLCKFVYGAYIDEPLMLVKVVEISLNDGAGDACVPIPGGLLQLQEADAILACDNVAETAPLDGTWQVVQRYFDGAEARLAGEVSYEFRENVATRRVTDDGGGPPRVLQYRFSLDTSVCPKSIDFMRPVQADAPQYAVMRARTEEFSVLGIYLLDDDMLTICCGYPGYFEADARPELFESSQEYPTILCVYRRVTEEDEE